MQDRLQQAAEILKNSKHTVAFTGAGISVESGIPPFRGSNGLWSKYDPIVLDIGYFHKNTNEAWKVIRELFYDFFGKAVPNAGHQVLAKWENEGLIKSVITQNIDNLHQEAGSKTVYEFHGTASTILCLSCGAKYPSGQVEMQVLPPKCPKCDGILKPDYIFFGEGIPEEANIKSFEEADKCDVFIIVGTTGEVMPASMLPHTAKKNGAKIIEINPDASHFTHQLTDVHLKGKAGEVLPLLDKQLNI